MISRAGTFDWGRIFHPVRNAGSYFSGSCPTKSEKRNTTTPITESDGRASKEPLVQWQLIRSVCVAFAQHLKKRLDQNLDIKPKTPVVNIPQIHSHPLGNQIHSWR